MNKILSVLTFLALIGLWFGFFRLLEFMPVSLTPAGVVYIVVMLALFVGFCAISCILVLAIYLCWKEK